MKQKFRQKQSKVKVGPVSPKNMVNNGLFWASHFKRAFIPEIEALLKSLLDLLLPTFNDLGKEAEKIAEEEHKKLCGLPSGENGNDESALAEKAINKGVNFYITMDDIKQGIINLFASAIYHVFEQQLFLFYRRELLNYSEENDIALLKMDCIRCKLKSFEIDLGRFKSWPKINELHHVANVVKHADGRSAIKLKLINPNLFQWPETLFRNISGNRKHSTGPVYQPLLGQGIYVTLEVFKIYSEAVCSFWFEFAEILEGKSYEKIY